MKKILVLLTVVMITGMVMVGTLYADAKCDENGNCQIY
jgi:uncharacterized protein YxeA